MASGIMEVVLSRDAQSTPWGFRLHGGKDIGYPLVIQRVFVGTPSEGELQRGDHLLQVQGRDSADLNHVDAHDIIKSAGTRLQMLIRRLPGGAQTPITPLTPGGMHPFAKLLRENAQQMAAPPLFQPMSPPRPANQIHQAPPPPRGVFSPVFLPTTAPHYPTPSPRNLADAELIEYANEKYRERDAMNNQGYRTLPLIAPKPKTRHDIPIGSYLRHVPDSNWIGRTPIGPSLPKFYNSFPTPTYSTIGHYSRRPRPPPPGAPMFEQAIDDNSQLVHHQYNSPMFLYSQSNIQDTIRDQTGLQSNTKPKLSVNTSAAHQGPPNAGPLSPGGNLAPAKPGTRLTNIVDITLSPTFQMIQEEENRSQSPLPETRTPTPGPYRRPATNSPRPPYEHDLNPMGGSKDIIHQSGSFKTLMSALHAPIGEQQEL